MPCPYNDKAAFAFELRVKYSFEMEGNTNDDGARASWKETAEDFTALILRLGLAGLFIYSAWHKIGDPIDFMLKVDEYEVLPAAWSEPFAYVLPWLMIAASASLIPGVLTRAGAGGLGLMLISFIIAISINVYRDRVLGCGCFSEEGHTIGGTLLAQDFALLACASYLVARGGRRFSLDALIPWRKFLPRKKEEPDEEETQD